VKFPARQLAFGALFVPLTVVVMWLCVFTGLVTPLSGPGTLDRLLIGSVAVLGATWELIVLIGAFQALRGAPEHRTTRNVLLCALGVVVVILLGGSGLSELTLALSR
jgi:uncharacterized protein YhhL (DUF1145 family)